MAHYPTGGGLTNEEMRRIGWLDKRAQDTPRAKDAAMSEANEVPEAAAGSEPAAPKKIQLNSKTRRGLALMRMLAASDPTMPPYQTLVDRLKKRNVDELNQALAWAEQNEDWESVEKCWDMMKERRS